jgi:hypothetical protein
MLNSAAQSAGFDGEAHYARKSMSARIRCEWDGDHGQSCAAAGEDSESKTMVGRGLNFEEATNGPQRQQASHTLSSFPPPALHTQ